MDRRLLMGAFALLILQVGWLLHDLRIIEWPWLEKRAAQISGEQVGEVVAVRQNVRRRGNSSLIWEPSTARDTLHAYDSVLTLQQSTAELFLANETRLHLAENTLVVIEPMDEQRRDAQIRIRFRQGQLAARTPTHPAAISADDWVIDVSKASEIQVNRLSNGEMEVEVIKGEARVQKESSKGAPGSAPPVLLQEGQLVGLKHDEVETRGQIAADLKWTPPNHRRVYSHHFPVAFPVSWSGTATHLEITDASKKIRLLALPTEGQQTTLTLDAGYTSLRLTDGRRFSQRLTAEVWRAPVIHLLTPLPRDRIPLRTQVQFRAVETTGVSTYYLQVKRDDPTSEILIKDNGTSPRFGHLVPDPGSYYWLVFGRDADGFVIPPLYTHPIYSVPDPLQAPELKAPELRFPADAPPDSTHVDPRLDPRPLWWRLLTSTPPAQAREETVEAVFQWQAVPGAAAYIIEISATPDFRSPLVIRTVTAPEYIWKQPSRQAIFWRVAGEAADGRMGLFSSVQRTDLSRLADGHVVAGVTLRRSEPTTAPLSPAQDRRFAAPVVPGHGRALRPEPYLENPQDGRSFRSPVEPKTVNGVSMDGLGRLGETAPSIWRTDLWKWRWRLWSGALFENREIEGTENSRVSVSGYVPLLVGGGFVLSLPNERALDIEAYYQQASWQRKPVAEYPFQPDLKDQRLSLQGFLLSNEIYAIGLMAVQTNILRRLERERVDMQKKWLYGPAARVEWGRAFRVRATGAWVWGGEISEWKMQLRASQYFGLSSPLQVEIGLSAGYDSLAGGEQAHRQWQSGLVFGVEW